MKWEPVDPYDPRGRAVLALSVALQRDKVTRELAELSHTRSLVFMQVQPSGDSASSEYAEYLGLFNAIAGTDLDPKVVKAMNIRRQFDQYEAATGYRIGSPEFYAAAERTAAGISNLSS